MRREGINPPKFADQFARIDFESEPMPILCLFPVPEPVTLEDLTLGVCGLDGQPHELAWRELNGLPRLKLRVPIICQLFNWSEEVEWEGIRLMDFLDHAGIDAPEDGYYAIYSRDGHYFETLSRDEARDPRALLAFGLNGSPLPDAHGGPLRLVVPFLQGYKSVKWVRSIRALRRDPVGIKRLRKHSRSGRLNADWMKKYGIAPPKGKAGDPE